jgi:hypothetical protein
VKSGVLIDVISLAANPSLLIPISKSVFASSSSIPAVTVRVHCDMMEIADSEEWETTQVLICGGGPTGALLSALLGRMSISNIVLEKESELYPYSRAFTLGETGIRLLRGVGLSDRIYTEIGGSQLFPDPLDQDILLN